MKNITFSAEGYLIEAARQRAVAEHTTLNRQFRLWLAAYVGEKDRLRSFDETVAELRGQLKVGRKLCRDVMNER